jgi:hypothetical protein
MAQTGITIERPAGLLQPPASQRPSPARTLLIAAVALMVLLTVMRAGVSWGNDAWINHPAGSLIAMATDLKAGVFYRPLYDNVGYGGTRYFPLYFVLQAELIKLGLPVLLSAYLLSAIALVSLIVGLFVLLRALGIEPRLAACSSGALLAANCAQYSLFSPHADGLAAALNIWGLAVIARGKWSSRSILVASVLFTLAWSAKLTTVFGLAAAFVWLLGSGVPRMAWALAAETICGYVAVTAGLSLGSHGRFWTIFKACASGGTNLQGALAGPLSLLTTAARLDPVILWFGALALIALARAVLAGKLSRNLPALLFIATFAVTAFIYGTPGVNENHLIDLQAAALVLIATELSRASVPQQQWGTAVLALAVLAATVPTLRHFKNHDLRFHRHRFQTVLATIGDTGRPILAENPVVPILAGQRPYVLDAWMLRVLRQRIPAFGDPLLDKVRNRSFGAVVLSMADPRSSFGHWWYETQQFGPGFAAALTDNYRLAATIDDQKIYLPIADPAQPAAGLASPGASGK